MVHPRDEAGRTTLNGTAAVIVCGSRDWTDVGAVHSVLEEMRSYYGHLHVIEGRARGADRMAGQWAISYRDGDRSVSWQPYYADWKNLPKWRAGPERNQRMLDRLLQCGGLGWDIYTIAFKDDFDVLKSRGGTEDMFQRARGAEVRCLLVTHDALPQSTFGFTARVQVVPNPKEEIR